MANIITALDVKFATVDALECGDSFARFDVRMACGSIVRDCYRGFVVYNNMVDGMRGAFEYDGNTIRVYALYTGALVFEMLMN